MINFNFFLKKRFSFYRFRLLNFDEGSFLVLDFKNNKMLKNFFDILSEDFIIVFSLFINKFYLGNFKYKLWGGNIYFLFFKEKRNEVNVINKYLQILKSKEITILGYVSNGLFTNFNFFLKNEYIDFHSYITVFIYILLLFVYTFICFFDNLLFFISKYKQ